MTQSSRPAPRKVSVLFLEDQPNDAELALHELARSGFDPAAKRVETEADFRAALADSPDLILADYNLPQFDGVSALKIAQEISPGIPFILISADMGEEIAVEAMRLGAADYLMKDQLARLGPAAEAALAGARLRREARRAEQLLEAVARGTARVLGEDFLHSLVRTVATALGVKFAFVGELHGDRVRTLALDVDGKRGDNFEYPLAGAPCDKVVAGKPCYYPSGVQALFPEDALLVEFGIESYLGFPLIGSDGRGVGLLAVLDGKPMEIGPAERAALESFAGRAAAELERLRGQQALQRSTRALRVLSECGQALARSFDEQSLLESVCRIACEAGGYRLAWVGYTEHDAEKMIRPVANFGDAEYLAALPGISWSADDPRGQGPAGRAIRSGTRVVERDLATAPEFARWSALAAAHGLASVIVLPLGPAEEVFGVLIIYAEEANSFDQKEVTLLEQLASDLAYGIVALRHARERAAAETERNRVRLQQQAVLEHAGIGIAFLKDRRIVRCNRHYAAIFGYAPQELVGRSIRLLHVSEQAYEQFGQEVYPRIFSGGAYSGDVQGRRKDDSIFWINNTLTPIDPVDLAQGVIHVVNDITERQAQQEAVRTSEERFRQLTELSSDYYWEQDEQFRFTLVSEGALHTGGRVPATTYGKTRWELPNEIPEEVWAAHRKLLEAHRPYRDFEFLQRLPDGTLVWIGASGDPIFDADGHFRGYRGIGRNITDRKRAEERLRESEERFRQLTELSSDWYWEQDEHFRFVSSSDGLREGSGRAKSEILGQTRWDLDYLDFADEKWAAHRACLEAHRPFRDFETARPGANGEPTHISLSGDPVFDENGKFTGYRGIGRNITDATLAEQRVRESEERFRHLTELSSDWYWEQDEQFRFTAISASAEGTGGRTIDTALGKTRWEIPNTGSEETWRAHRAVLESHQPYREFEFPQFDQHGETVWISVSGDPMRDASGRFRGYRGTARNVTRRKQVEETLRLNSRAIEASSNGIMITDAREPGRPIVSVNPAFEAITGYSAEEALGRDPSLLLGKDQEQFGIEELRAALREERPGVTELRNFRKDGATFWNQLAISPVRDPNGVVTHWVSVINDVTERKRYEEALERQANYDSLTGLANRNLLFDRIRQAIVHSGRSGRAMAVLLLDLDRFKLINDSYGHLFGDALLRVISERLATCVRRDDTVARLGGDEFVIMLADMAREDDASTVARKVLDAISRPVVIEGRDLLLTTSLGVAVHPRDGETPEILLKNADAAMYRAKEQGRNAFQFYTEEMNARAAQYLTIQGDLVRALANEEFELHYQPIIDCKRGDIRGAEALIRWRKPDGTMVSPADFIPLAEDSGLIVPIGAWALRTACAQTRAWHDAGFGSLGISVNLSPRQFREKDLGAMISAVLAETGLPANRLALEITEGTVMDRPEEAAATMRELAAMGIGISIDDFGTGYSSLGYLNRFPVRDLKIDRTFVRDLDTGEGGATLVTAIIGLAHSLGVKVVAEGVETAEQLAFLVAQRCDAAQGFFLSRPIPVAPFGALLAERRKFVTGPVTAAEPRKPAPRPKAIAPRGRKSTGIPPKSRGKAPKKTRLPASKSGARRKVSR